MSRSPRRRALRKLVATLTIALFLPGVAGMPPAAANPLVPVEPDFRTVAQGNGRFAFDLYDRLKVSEGNVVFSPYSISSALAMTYAGARTETAAQMARVLQFELPPSRLHAAFATLQHVLGGVEEDAAAEITLNVANRLWGAPDEEFLDEFLRTIRTHYEGGFETFPSSSAEEARRIVNEWVAAQTNDKIRDLVRKPDMPAVPSLVLVNALYFQGNWSEPFDSTATGLEEFHVSRARTVTTPMMHRTGEHRYGETDDLQILELPYENDRLSMVVLLPEQRDGLASLEGTLTPGLLEKWLKELSPRQVAVDLPRFRIEYRALLEQELAAMGMPLAFSMEEADFSGMGGQALGNLFIDHVIHQALVEVTETGTEAAASTVVSVLRASESIGRPTVFRADHPFLFLIRDRVTDSVLFLGRVTNPGEIDV